MPRFGGASWPDESEIEPPIVPCWSICKIHKVSKISVQSKVPSTGILSVPSSCGCLEDAANTMSFRQQSVRCDIMSALVTVDDEQSLSASQPE